jgi:hypothetical protein
VFSAVRVVAASRQQLGKHVPAAIDTNATIKNGVFYVVRAEMLHARNIVQLTVEFCMGGCEDRT